MIKRLEMLTNKFLLSFLIVSAIMCASCAPKVTKGSVYQGISKGIRIGADKSEVIRYVDSLEVNGVKPTRQDYVRDTSGKPVVASDGREVAIDGTIYVSFSNGTRDSFCNHVGVIFYFDKSGKLITYQIDCFP